MRNLAFTIFICSFSLNLLSQEIDWNKVEDNEKQEKVFDKPSSGFILKFGANTFLGSGTPSYLVGESYTVPSSTQANESVTPNSSQGVIGFNDYIELTDIQHGRCYGFNASVGYKGKLYKKGELYKKLYFSLEVCYNSTRRRSVSSYWTNHLDLEDDQHQWNSRTLKTKSVSVPISILCQFNKRLNVEFGINGRYSFSKTEGDDLERISANEFKWIVKPSFTSKTSLSPFIGVNYNITKNIFVNTRCYIGDKVFLPNGYLRIYGNLNDHYELLPARFVSSQLQFSIGFNLN
jgi:hypothetical protein